MDMNIPPCLQRQDGETARLFFRPLEPFLIEGSIPPRPGQIRRASMNPVWQWLGRDGAPELLRELETIYAGSPDTGRWPSLSIGPAGAGTP